MNPIRIEIENGLWPDSVTALDGAMYPRLNGHCQGWVKAISSGLNHPVITIRSDRGGTATGLLPLVLMSGPLFGRFLVSMPYINTGGVWSSEYDSALALVDEACRIADKNDVRYLELRHEVPLVHPKLNIERTDKVHMRLELPETGELLLKGFKSKLRNQIKKSTEYGLEVNWGSHELLGDFYRVFAHNMRDLGTPVFPKRWFASVLTGFGQNAELCVIRNDNRPIAGAIVVHFRGITEVPSASSLRAYNRSNANMLMYWNLLQRAIERGSHQFDFGRSSKGSGTYAFKEQWGALPQPAVWQYYVRRGSVQAMRPDAPGNRRLIRVWQKMPVWLTRWIGPVIVRGIP